MTTPDVAVVGLGIVGACATWAAARAGARVLALDAGVPGEGTSGTSFAWLNSARKEPESYHRLNAEGMLAHAELARELGDAAGRHAGGGLQWAADDAGERELRAHVERLTRWGYAAEWISRARAAAMEPALALPAQAREVVFCAEEGWLDAPRTIRALLAAAAARGAEIRTRIPVRTLRRRGVRVDGLVLEGEEAEARNVLVCLGPATQAFLAPLGVDLPVGRVPGLLAVTSPLRLALGRVVHAPGIHLRPEPGGGLLLGSEDVDGPAAGASPSMLDELAGLLLERAARVVPGAHGARIVDRRVGVRPMPADHHTIAGPLPGLEGAWVIATHSGVTLGALLGRLMAAEILDGARHASLAPFRPERFAPVAR
jgi:glycine/D-amino acid oxidase-like deaminating enzyme